MRWGQLTGHGGTALPEEQGPAKPHVAFTHSSWKSQETQDSLLGAHPAPEHDIGYLVRAGTEGLSIATQEKSPAQRLEEREVLNDGPDSPRTLGGQQDSQEPAGRKPFQ